MTFTELIPSLQQLSSQDKLKAIQFLANQLAEEEQTLSLLEDGKTYHVLSPHDAFYAENVLTKMLDEYAETSNKTVQ